MKLLWCLAIFLSAVQLSAGGKILVFTAMPSRSHHNLVERFATELAKKGHEVTYLTQFETKPVPNLKQIVLPEYHKNLSATFSKDGEKDDDLFEMRHMPKWAALLVYPQMGHALMHIALNIPKVQELINSNQRFDVILGELFLDESMLAGFSYKFKAPVIAIQPFMPNIWASYLVGNPLPLSYIPDFNLGYTSRMTFWQRLENTIYGLADEINHRFFYIPMQDKIMRKFFGDDLPPLDEMVKNTSLVLVNHHYSLGYPRPNLPNMVEVGGFHINPVKRLPDDLQKYMDESKNGVILFSMGSNLKSSNMPNELKRGILNAFSRLKQNVLWKFEDDSLKDIPKNVKISKWLPQSDILAHPNIKLFITHGGLLSTTESVYRGVPMVGIPIFGDQPVNMRYCELGGYALSLDYDTLTEESFYNAINQVLTDPKYKESATRASKLLRDTAIPAMENALYWIEYVMRHKGAPHLKSAAQDLKWYELYLWDVFGTLLLIAVLATYISCKATKLVFKKVLGLFSSKKKSDKISKDKKKK